MELLEVIATEELAHFDRGVVLATVSPLNLVGWHRRGGRLVVVLRHRGAARDILETVEVSMFPSNMLAQATLMAWIPKGGSAL